MRRRKFFYGCMASWANFKKEKDLAPWLYRMTVNLCHDLRCRSKPSVALELAPALRDAALDPEQSMELLQRQREREAIVLRDLEGFRPQK